MRRIHHHVTWLGLLVLAGSAAAALNLSQVPPFFVLDGPGFAWFENCSATPSNKLDEYARSQGSLDLWTLRLALQSRARVLQPELARIFLVPTLLGYMSDGKRCLGRTSQQMQQITVLALQQSPFWRLRGASHLIVGGNWWISRTFGRDFIRKILPHTIFVSTMRKAGSEISACWLVAPYVEPPYTRSALPHGVGAGGLDNRPLAFSFVGDLGLVRSRGRPWYYARRADRRAFLTAVASSSHLSSVSAVVHAPNSILLDPTHHAAHGVQRQRCFPSSRPATSKCHAVGSKCTGFPQSCLVGGSCLGCSIANRSFSSGNEVLRHSRFCPVLRGDSPGSQRIYHCIAMGAVPVIIDDELKAGRGERLPFHHIVDWQRFIFRIRSQPWERDRIVNGLTDLAGRQKEYRGKFMNLVSRQADVNWRHNESRVFHNLLYTTVLQCDRQLPTTKRNH